MYTTGDQCCCSAPHCNVSLVCAGLAHLTGLQHLTQLNLAYTAITDSGLGSVQCLTSLLDLNLDSCNITDR